MKMTKHIVGEKFHKFDSILLLEQLNKAFFYDLEKKEGNKLFIIIIEYSCQKIT